MDEITIFQFSKEELDQIVQDAVRAALSEKAKPVESKPYLKGIQELAEFLGISLSKAQKLKNDGVLPYFQDNRLVLFDPEKIQEAIAKHNQKRKSRH